jgi:hypothetical protein
MDKGCNTDVSKITTSQRDPPSLLDLCAAEAAKWLQKEDVNRIPRDLWEPLQRHMSMWRQKKVFGQAKKWYENGQQKYVKYWDADRRRNGEWIYWHEDGGRLYVRNWKYGIAHGKWIHYDRDERATHVNWVKSYLQGILWHGIPKEKTKLNPNRRYFFLQQTLIKKMIVEEAAEGKQSSPRKRAKYDTDAYTAGFTEEDMDLLHKYVNFMEGPMRDFQKLIHAFKTQEHIDPISTRVRWPVSPRFC